MAEVSTSGYVPFWRALTSKSGWLWLNCFTSSLTVSPSCPPMACQKWIFRPGPGVCGQEHNESSHDEGVGTARDDPVHGFLLI